MEQLHPVHQAFRLFHQAVCYEALGLAAHNYSRNKIPFFDSAKEKFAAALDILPQPFANDESGRCDSSKSSPLDAIFNSPDSRGKYSERSSKLSAVPSIQVSSRTRTPSDASSRYSSSSASSSASDTFTVPDFDQYSPRPNSLAAPKSIPRTITFPDVQKQDEEWNNDEQSDSDESTEDTPRKLSYQNRLSTCLSSKHVLSEDLVPAPLFNRTKKIARITFPGNVDDTNANNNAFLTTREPPRALPRTPYNHQTHLTLLPSRPTAVQTLISRFEQTLPSPDTPSSYTTASLSGSAHTSNTAELKTPVTARFANIASIFDPQTPTPTRELTISQYLTSHALARYNSSISAFRKSLDSSIARIESMINEAHEIQERHFREKQEAAIRDAQSTTSTLGQARMRSYWLLSTPATPASPNVAKSVKLGRTPGQDERGLTVGKRMKDDVTFETPRRARNSTAYTPTASATPMTPTPATTTKTRLESRLAALRARAREGAAKKAERIANLRATGFAVRKEQYGWKGARHYEELRRSVEVELGA